MRPTRVTFLLLATLFQKSVNGAPEWEDQSVFRVGTEAPRAHQTRPYETREAALLGTSSEWARELSGLWKFAWCGNPAFRVENFQKPTFDDSSWENIRVPSNWQLEGYGVPLYTNIRYPFHVDPPRVMGEPPAEFTHFPWDARNEVGQYRRIFSITETWSGREIFLTFGGIDSAAYVWVNGHLLGYVQDSRTPSEFHLTPYLQAGENLLAVEVYQHSDGSYLEDQDMWRLSGIFRDVTLWASNPLELRDVAVTPTLESPQGNNGELSISVELQNRAAEASGQTTLSFEILSPDGHRVFHEDREVSLASGEKVAIHVTARLSEILPWTAETPALYTVLLGLGNGEAKDYFRVRSGFRHIEVKNGQVLINGRPVLFKGINRHEHDPDTGHYMTREAVREDLLVMKRLNLNAIRTAHYPHTPAFYELCDELGFYVISEANLEAHGLGLNRNPLAEDPTWYPAFLSRAENMVETFKNHPSVFSWSMGNEAGDGENFERVSQWLRERDPSRLVHYDRASRKPHVDFFSRMYERVYQLEEYVAAEEEKPLEQQRPAIICEYSHAMGNSSGCLSYYWEIFRRHRLLQGGFIWDFKDQGLSHTWQTTDGPRRDYAYGGDFGDFPNSDSFCLNGLVMPDRRWSPQAWEAKKLLQPVWTRLDSVTPDAVLLDVFNERFFRSTEDLEMVWQLTRDGQLIGKGHGPAQAVAPQEHRTVELDLSTVNRSAPGEYQLRVSYRHREDTPWAPAGSEVAWDQFTLPGSVWTAPQIPVGGKPPELTTGPEGLLVVTGPHFEAVFDGKTGHLLTYQLDGDDRLAQPMTLDFWRAPTNNDRGRKLPEEAAFWRDAGPLAEADQVEIREEEGRLYLRFDYTLGQQGSRASLSYAISGNGAIQVSVSVSPAAEDGIELPRIGLTTRLANRFARWTWYGLGPHENYVDRQAGSWLGIHSGTVDELFHPYIDPQESGNRTGIRWASFTAADGSGWRISSLGDHLLEIGATPYTADQLEEARHQFELSPSSEFTLHLDYGQTGLGGTDSTGAKPADRDRLFADRIYHYSFLLEPLTP
jgi:beta-galactosidase